MFTRRALLTAGVVVTGGCTALRSGTRTRERNETETPSNSARGDTPAFARWSRQLPHDDLGHLSLGGGPETPAIFVGSAASDSGATEIDHALYALSLRSGDEQWRVAVPNPVQTAPLYAGTGQSARLVFATGRQSLHGDAFEIHAVDSDSGERGWQFDIDARRFLFPVVASEDSVFVGQRDDQLRESGEAVYALDPADGTERWRAETGDVSRGGNARRRDTVLVTTLGRVTAIDAVRGERRWQVAANSVAYDNRGERVFVGTENAVRAVGLTDGSERWRRDFDSQITSIATPRAAMDETVFVGDYDGRLHALSPLDGEIRWTLSVPGGEFRPSVQRTSERLYVAGAGLHALDPVSGERHWSFTPDGERGVRVAASRTVFAWTERRLWALDPGTGEIRWEFAPEGEFAGVATAGHFAFVGVGGAAYALDGRKTSDGE